jgi:hypothetical protein
LFSSKASDAAFLSNREPATHPRVMGLTLHCMRTKQKF